MPLKYWLLLLKQQNITRSHFSGYRKQPLKHSPRNSFTLKVGKKLINKFDRDYFLTKVWGGSLTNLLKLTFYRWGTWVIAAPKMELFWTILKATKRFKDNVQIFRDVLVFSHKFQWLLVHLFKIIAFDVCLRHCQYLFNSILVRLKRATGCMFF